MAPQPRMHPLEWWGRVVLAGAVGALFLVVFASMVTGGLLWIPFVIVVTVGLAAGAALIAGRGRGY